MENKDILNELLRTLLEGIQQAGAFVKEQLPLVLQEYVQWGVAEGVIMAARVPHRRTQQTSAMTDGKGATDPNRSSPLSPVRLGMWEGWGDAVWASRHQSVPSVSGSNLLRYASEDFRLRPDAAPSQPTNSEP